MVYKKGAVGAFQCAFGWVLLIPQVRPATTVATLSKNNRRGDERRNHTDAGGEDRKNGRAPKRNNSGGRTNLWDQNDPPKGTLKCPNCSLFVYHKPEKCYELEANKSNRPSMWKSVKDR